MRTGPTRCSFLRGVQKSPYFFDWTTGSVFFGRSKYLIILIMLKYDISRLTSWNRSACGKSVIGTRLNSFNNKNVVLCGFVGSRSETKLGLFVLSPKVVPYSTNSKACHGGLLSGVFGKKVCKVNVFDALNEYLCCISALKCLNKNWVVSLKLGPMLIKPITCFKTLTTLSFQCNVSKHDLNYVFCEELRVPSAFCDKKYIKVLFKCNLWCECSLTRKTRSV